MKERPGRYTGLILGLAAVLVLLLAAPAAQASPIAQKKAKLRAIQAKLERAYTQAEIATEKYNQATSQLDTVKAKIRENQRLLDMAEYNLRIADQQLKQRAENMYKSRDVGIIDVLFASDSFDDLVTQMDLMQRLGDSDVDTIHAIAAYRRDIKDRRIKLEADKQAATKLVAQRAADRDAVLGLESKLKKMTKGLKAEIKRLRDQEQARLQAALQGYNGTIPTVDPNSPGHPEIVGIAKRYFGVPYVWGGASPSTGFDCSGLTMYCYAQIGIGLAHGATAQQQASTPVALSDLRPGDLVFFGNASFSHHVAIFVGGTTIIEAPHSGDVVRYGSYAGRDAWIGGRF